jgi:pimeloyl-ACP methyl ester carboxylesterase
MRLSGFPTCALLALLSSTPGLAADAPLPQLQLDPARIEAGEDLRWTVDLRVMNPRTIGLYLDSLHCTIEDLTAGDPTVPRTRLERLDALVASTATIEAGGEITMSYFLPAFTDSARLTFRLFTHSSQGASDAISATTAAGPGAFQRAHPSESIPAAGGQVEVVTVRAESEAKAPGILLVHAEGSSARRELRAAEALSKHGYHVVTMSLPGFGGSSGRRAFTGKAASAATKAALDKLASTPGVDAARLALWTSSLGAIPALNLAADDARVGATVVSAGVFDLSPAGRASLTPTLRGSLLGSAPGDTSGLTGASPLARVAAIHGRTLVVHGERDLDCPVTSARQFVAALESAKREVESKFLPSGRHTVGFAAVIQTATGFLERALH